MGLINVQGKELRKRLIVFLCDADRRSIGMWMLGHMKYLTIEQANEWASNNMIVGE